MKAKIIPAKKNMIRQSGTGEPLREPQRLRVAAYARVSTDSEEQETSYEAQRIHYTNLICGNPAYIFAGMYADEGISGLSTKNREQFNQMIRDCEEGKIDMILTKSVSRWARNTLDSIRYIRKLKALGVEVYFEKENIRTLDASGELLLTIMSSLAQQESESISRNVQLGVRYHFQEGKACGGHQNILGYRRSAEGKLEIIPEEAGTVRRIFRMYLDGYTPRHIGEMLSEEHVKIRDGNERSWGQQSIRYILSNQKYCGDLILQRYYTVDVLSKKRAENTGQLPQYLVEDVHEPIIPKEVFWRTQAELMRRSETKERYEKKYGLGGKVVCGYCGCSFVRKKEGKRAVYRCITKVIGKGTKRYRDSFSGINCVSGGVDEERIKQAVVTAFNRAARDRDELIILQDRIRRGPLREADGIIEALRMEIDELSEKEEKSEENYDELNKLQLHLALAEQKRAEFADKEMQIRNLLDRISFINKDVNKDNNKDNNKDINKDIDKYAGKEGRGGLSACGEETFSRQLPSGCSDTEDFFERTGRRYPPGPVTEFDPDDGVRFIEKIVVGDEISVEFKAGIKNT